MRRWLPLIIVAAAQFVMVLDSSVMITADYGNAELDALKKAMLAVGLLALLSIVFTRRLPDKPMTQLNVDPS